MNNKLPVFPNLVVRETTVTFLVLGLLSVFALAFPLELLPPADPAGSDLSAKAPWFFVGMQELLYHMPTSFSAFMFPLIAVVFLFSLPYLSWKQIELASLKKPLPCIIWCIVWLGISAAFVFLAVVPFYSQMILTTVFLIFTLCAIFGKGRASKLTVTLSFFIYLCVSYLLWTVTGLMFRTDSWDFCLPFS